MQTEAVEHTHFTLVEKILIATALLVFKQYHVTEKKQTTKQPTKATNVSFTVRIMLDLT